MMFQAVLSNRDHPEYGVATIPFPIPHDQYAHCMDLLEALEIGDAVRADCKVEKIDGLTSSPSSTTAISQRWGSSNCRTNIAPRPSYRSRWWSC